MFSEEELAVQFRRTKVPPHLVPHHLMPFARHLAENEPGQRRGALLLATNRIFENLRRQQGSRVFFPPMDRAFNGQATLRRRRI